MRKVCSLPSQEMSLSNQGCPLPRRMSVRVTFHVKNESLSPLGIECDCTVLLIWCHGLVILCFGDGFL